MAQKLTNIQEQTQQLQQQLQQRLTAQQVMVVKMLEMPLAQFEQNIQTELDENPALDSETLDPAETDMASDNDNENENRDDSDGSLDDIDDYDESFNRREEQQERQDELDSVLDSLDRDDRMESSNYERSNNYDPDADQEERVFGNSESFYDRLHEQMGELDLTERQETIMKHLIGSLDNDGLLRKDLATLSDEISIFEYIDTNEDELEHVLTILQSFDPAGIGAQSLQQCLLIQIFRMKPTPLTKLMHTVINEHYDEWSRKHWDKIRRRMQMSEQTAEEVFNAIRHLNPRPGAALGETMGKSIQQITPDFIIDVDNEDNISFHLNRGNVPQLFVSRDFEDMMEGYRQNPDSMTKRDKEALVYMQRNMNRAKMFIDAIKQRHLTMTQTMKALIKMQRQYIISGDESDLRPMIQKDIADITGYDISTISRVCSSKYAETPWGIIPLNSFFSNGYTTDNGEEVSTREIKLALKELIDNESTTGNGKPLSDLKLAQQLKTLGYPIARRTVAKYREQLGIPTSNLRK